jgi:hypothetical protein
MRRRKLLGALICTVTLLIWDSCVERFEIRSENYSEYLVVDGHLTTDVERQMVRISKTSYVNKPEFLPESGAQVNIVSGNGSTYPLSEEAPGIYTSAPFAGTIGTTYKLHITRANGRRYSSTDVQMRKTPDIGKIYGQYLPIEQGVQLYVDTEDPTQETNFFRWQFEETYIIKTPFPSNYEWLGGNDWVFRTQPVGVCYPTVSSSNVLIRSTLGLNEDQIVAFPLRFIDKTSYVLRIKYSIVVRQYSLSEEGYTYWKTLKDINESQGTLYDKQPGTVVGNVSAEEGNELVLGYFDASAVSKRRIFLTPADFESAGYVPPGYQTSCRLLDPILAPVDQIGDYMKKYPNFLIWDAIGMTPAARFELLPKNCCDCTNIGTNIQPAFWQ